ncbi:MAG: hypothetical protein EGQ26_02035 [Clostridiales bacterium]|nr:hypothetical protein [Clostridiales bacterium]
MLFSQNSASKW